jgi:hypothetical protein
VRYAVSYKKFKTLIQSVDNYRTLTHIKSEVIARNIIISESTLRNYCEPVKKGTRAARSHVVSSGIKVASTDRTETEQHVDGHYCLASVKQLKDLKRELGDSCLLISQVISLKK